MHEPLEFVALTHEQSADIVGGDIWTTIIGAAVGAIVTNIINNWSSAKQGIRDGWRDAEAAM